MNNPEIMAAKMICKSVDALTREIYLLRKSAACVLLHPEKKFFATGRG